MLASFHRLQLAVACLLALATASCSKSTAPKTLPVTGKVTLNQQPLDRATVTFNPQNGRPSVGITDANGYYELRYTSDVDGALPGQHLVTIVSEVSPSGGEGSPAVPGRKELLPKQYHAQSQLTADVKPGQKEYNFDLQSKAP